MKKPAETTKALWDKLSPAEQKEWKQLFKIFLEELNTLSNLHNNYKAHNLAYKTIWMRQGK